MIQNGFEKQGDPEWASVQGLSDRATIEKDGDKLVLTYKPGDALSMIRFLSATGAYILALMAFRSGRFDFILPPGIGTEVGWLLFLLIGIFLYRLLVQAMNGIALVCQPAGLEVQYGPIPPVKSSKIKRKLFHSFTVLEGSSRGTFNLVHRDATGNTTILIENMEGFETPQIFCSMLQKYYFSSEEIQLSPPVYFKPLQL